MKLNRGFQITVKPLDGQPFEGQPFEYDGLFEDSIAATHDALERFGVDAGIKVVPTVERSFGEGWARFPAALNWQASEEAREGWRTRAHEEVLRKAREQVA